MRYTSSKVLKILNLYLFFSSFILVAGPMRITELAYSAMHDDDSLFLQKLSEFGDINRQTIDGNTALHAVCFSESQDPLNNKLKGAERLLARGANPSIQTKEAGYTALHFAVEANHKELVVLLLNTKPDLVNKGNQLGWTPLFSAVEGNNYDMVHLLLEYGASRTSKINEFGDTPISMARELKHDRIVGLLQQTFSLRLKERVS